MRSNPLLISAVAGAALFATACSAEDLAETAVEQAIESETGGDVDLEFDDGDGTFTVETDEFSATYGDGGDLPDRFPASFDVAEGMTVIFSGEAESGSSYDSTVILDGERSTAEVVAYYVELAVAEGYTVDREIETELDVAANLSRGDVDLNIIGGNNGTNNTVSITFMFPLDG